jgi:hypothetical protein
VLFFRPREVSEHKAAIPPDKLVEIIREAITSRLDRAAYDAVLAEEERIQEEFRRTLQPALRRIGGGS